jgi:hypothetical protein
MAVPNKISPTAAPNVAPATNRVAGVRSGASGGSRVDELTYSPWLGNADASPRFEDYRQDTGQFQDQRRRQREDLWALTPLMTRFAASFVANESVPSANDNPEENFANMVARTEVTRGIGVYEQNMLATSQEIRHPGTLLNHFY